MKPKLIKAGRKWHLINHEPEKYPVVRVFDTLPQAMTVIHNRGPWIYRYDATYPFQSWCPFDKSDIVEIANQHGTRTGFAGDFWWGYSDGLEGEESVIRKARRVCF